MKRSQKSASNDGSNLCGNKLRREQREDDTDQNQIPDKETQHSSHNEVFEWKACAKDTDTEAAIQFVVNMLRNAKNSIVYTFPPVVFVHQLGDVVKNKTEISRQIEMLRNNRQIVMIHIGTEETMRVVLFLDHLKDHILQKCSFSEKFVYQKYFDQVLSSTADVGITRNNLLLKHRFSEKEVRLLISSGLLILKETGILWFSFPHAGIFMKKLLKGRRTLLQIIKKRKHQEMLEQDLKNFPTPKAVDFPIMYHIHDLVGGNFVDCIQTSSGRLLRSKS